MGEGVKGEAGEAARLHGVRAYDGDGDGAGEEGERVEKFAVWMGSGEYSTGVLSQRGRSK